MNHKPILAFDCASGQASITLALGESMATRILPQNRQSAELVSAMDALMKTAGVGYTELGLLVTTIGPGSFTGLRAGLAVVHGLALVHRTPVKTLTTLEALAWSVAPHADIARFTAAMLAGKGELYAQDFVWENNMPAAQSDIYRVPEAFADWKYPAFGNQNTEGTPHYLAGADTEALCRMAVHLRDTPLAEVMPLYIREPDAKLPTA